MKHLSLLLFKQISKLPNDTLSKKNMLGFNKIFWTSAFIRKVQQPMANTLLSLYKNHIKYLMPSFGLKKTLGFNKLVWIGTIRHRIGQATGTNLSFSPAL